MYSHFLILNVDLDFAIVKYYKASSLNGSIFNAFSKHSTAC